MPRNARNPNDRFPQVEKNFEEYEALRIALKRTLVDPVDLKHSPAHVAYIGQSDLEHEVTGRPGIFQAEQSTKTQLKYALKIFIKSFGAPPCLRFDSRAHVHFNAESGNGLENRDVPAPHFHKVDSDGWLRAYHTPQLADPASTDQISNDFTLGTNLFCQEFNLVSPSGGTVALKLVAQTSFLSRTGRLDTAKLP